MLTRISIPRVLPAARVRSAGEAYLQFAVGSRAFNITPLDGEARPADRDCPDPTAFCTSREEVDRCCEKPLLFRSDGERAEIASVIVDLGDGRVAIVSGGSVASSAQANADAVGEFCGGGVSVTEVVGRPEDFVYDAEKYKAEMERRLAVAGPGQRERRFFYGIDRATHPRLAGPRFVLPDVRHIVQTSFEHRVRQYRDDGKKDASLPKSVAYDDPDVRAFIDGALDIIEELMADLRPGEIDDAFDHFANGALRLRLPNGEWTTQPSSGYFFFFGELGLIGAHQRDATTWLPFARAAIRAQEIFVRVYKEPGENRNPYNRYSGCAFDESKQCTAAEQAELRARYGAMFVDQLQRQACENALEHLDGVC